MYSQLCFPTPYMWDSLFEILSVWWQDVQKCHWDWKILTIFKKKKNWIFCLFQQSEDDDDALKKKRQEKKPDDDYVDVLMVMIFA